MKEQSVMTQGEAAKGEAPKAKTIFMPLELLHLENRGMEGPSRWRGHRVLSGRPYWRIKEGWCMVPNAAENNCRTQDIQGPVCLPLLERSVHMGRDLC